jgi:hypothetical protein
LCALSGRAVPTSSAKDESFPACRAWLWPVAVSTLVNHGTIIGPDNPRASSQWLRDLNRRYERWPLSSAVGMRNGQRRLSKRGCGPLAQSLHDDAINETDVVVAVDLW